MSTILSEEQQAIEASLDALCREHISEPYLQECDRTPRYPSEVMDALAGAGWASLIVPAEYGGTQASREDLALVHRVLANHSLAVSQAYFSCWVLGAEAITRLGTAEQREEWLPRIAAGEAKVAFALTEPESGSDAAALRTTADATRGGFIVNGQKVFITAAGISDVIIVAVRTKRAQDRRQGISLLMLDPATEGMSVRPLPKMGLKSLEFCEIFFDNAFVPDSALLGELHEGWSGMRPGLAAERTFIAACCTGALEHVFDLSLAYSREREAFGRPIGSNQYIAGKLVEMNVNATTSWLLTQQAARTIDDGGDAEVEAAMAKLVASESYVSATRDGVQIFGGYGYTEEYPIARHYRDAKFMEIGAGTSEIQRIIIARSMGL